VLAFALAAAMFFAGKRAARVTPPEFKQLTYRRGTIWNARFAPDGRVVYAASWEGAPSTIFIESRSLGATDADILAISRSGQMLVSLHRHNTGPFQRAGTLAQMSVDGSSAPRELTNDVREADWTPDEKEMMVVRDVGGHSRIELPIGHILYETSGWVSSARVSHDGLRVAFLDHTILNDDGGAVAEVDRTGKKKMLSGQYQTLAGLAWSPRDEVWFSGSKEGANRALYAAGGPGHDRLLARVAGSVTLHDITADGRAVVTQDVFRMRLFISRDGEKEHELTWLDWSIAGDLTNDGKEVVFAEAGEGGGPGYSVFIRNTDGSPAIRLGEGIGLTLSPDRQWVVGIAHSGSVDEVMLFPTGAGMARRISTSGLKVNLADWMTDGKQILFTGSDGKSVRLYLQSLAGGAPQPISGDGFHQFVRTISADGKWVAATGPDQKNYLVPIAGGEPRLLSNLMPGDQPSGWTADGSSLYVFTRGQIPVRVYRLNVQSGEKTLWKELQPYDTAGMYEASRVLPTSDGKTYVASYRQQLSDLFLLDGL
jgi:Tol biopolymer transport system component